MDIDIGRIGLLIVASIFVGIWIILANKEADTYKHITDTIDADKYKYPELFCIGFTVMKLLHIDTQNKKARMRIKEIAEIQGKRYAEYHFYVINGAKWTYGYTIFTIVSVLAAMGNSPILFVIAIALAVLLMWYVDETLNDELEARREELLADFPQMLSKMALLVNSGMMVRDAWKKIAFTSNRTLYKEMQLTVQEMQNGVLETEAYYNFGERCTLKEIRRFSSTMVQTLQKGNGEISMFLKDMADDMWEEKKHLVKRKGEAANSKLLIPTTLIFIGILIIIIVPAFSGL